MKRNVQYNQRITKSTSVFFKGQCHEISDLWFFHQTIPSGHLNHWLKPFWIWLRIREVIRQSRWHSAHHCRWLSGINDTTEADTAVSMTPLRPTQRCQWHSWGRHSGVNDTVVSMTRQCRPQWCNWHRWVAVPRDLEFEGLWLPLKGISIKKESNCTTQ
jgi:hypothetical protein